MNFNELKDFAHDAQAMIAKGEVEDKLRHHLTSKLYKIFPDSPWWIQAHMEGTEAHVHFSIDNKKHNGFVDALVGKTAIEYEKNLNQKAIFDEGFYQVKEYCAALRNLGVPLTEILGVLSDTVRWYGYSVTIKEQVEENHLYGPDDIVLVLQMKVDLSQETNDEFQRFDIFVSKFLDRKQSRLLTASTLVRDFGIESTYYAHNISSFRKIVEKAIHDKPDYAKLIEKVWQNFVAYIGVSDYGSFSINTYINEFYLVTVAKIICADILAGNPIISNSNEIRKILDGSYFTGLNIHNFVDYDYFGWLNDSPYVEQFANMAADVQQRLVAYDFSLRVENDIFGRLLAQLADKEHRLMLGQEFTPHWVAHDIVAYNMDRLNGQIPRIVDMCCGSGVFLIESIKEVRRRYSISPSQYSAKKDDIAFSCVMGFDIDPLAVMLAKVNWIIAMRDLFDVHHGNIVVPIYHADSLFAATPITHKMPSADGDAYVLSFEHQEVSLPAFLLSTNYRKVFDSLMSKAYRLAMIRAARMASPIDENTIFELIDSVEEDSETKLSDDKRELLCSSACSLITELELLQREGRNGIWYFIISNSYRPGLTGHQFNCIVSNPPWMAMSKLADNPYKDTLHKIADFYGIKPVGPAFPHMELATVFLLRSIDRYLASDAYWSCVMPGSLLNGLNHEPLRKEAYRSSNAALPMKFDAIWELPQNTFKNKAIVLSGTKSDAPSSDKLDGRIYKAPNDYKETAYVLRRQNGRTAWAKSSLNQQKRTDKPNEIGVTFTQGCDLFPRTALFHEFKKRPDGNWDIAPIDAQTSDIGYLVNDQKKNCCPNLAATNVDKAYVFDAYISKHLSPFVMASTAKVLIPGKKIQGKWKTITPTDRALMNDGTSYLFNEIEEDSNTPQNLDSYLEKKINVRGKLYRQNFVKNNWLVLSNAGGSHPCAAYIHLNDELSSRLIVDQTLYWHITDKEDEALFIVGLLNSDAMANAIKIFQPEGGFGKRHIHSLPYKLMPVFNHENENHMKVVKQTRELIREWKICCSSGQYSNLLNPNSGTLNSRRHRQQDKIRNLGAYTEYEQNCRVVLGI